METLGPVTFPATIPTVETDRLTLRACAPARLHACAPARLRACPLARLPARLPACPLPACLPAPVVVGGGLGGAISPDPRRRAPTSDPRLGSGRPVSQGRRGREGATGAKRVTFHAPRRHGLHPHRGSRVAGTIAAGGATAPARDTEQERREWEE